MAVHELPVFVDVDHVPAVIDWSTGDFLTWLVFHTFSPARHSQAVQACIAIKQSMDIFIQ